MTEVGHDTALPIRALSPDESRLRSLRYLLQSNARLLSVNVYRNDEQVRATLKDFCDEVKIESVEDLWRVSFRGQQISTPRREFRFYTVRRNGELENQIASNESQRNGELARGIVLQLCGLADKASSPAPRRTSASVPSVALIVSLVVLAFFPMGFAGLLALGAYLYGGNSRFRTAWILAGSVSAVVFFMESLGTGAGWVGHHPASFVLLAIALVVLGDKATDWEETLRQRDTTGQVLLVGGTPLLLGLAAVQTDSLLVMGLLALLFAAVIVVSRLLNRHPIWRALVPSIGLMFSSLFLLPLALYPLSVDVDVSILNFLILLGATCSLAFGMSVVLLWGSFGPGARVALLLGMPLAFLGAVDLWPNLAWSAGTGILTFAILVALAQSWSWARTRLGSR